MGAIDVLIVVGFVVYALASGWRARTVASQSLEEYFLAGRSLPGWKAGLSMAATQFAADTPLLVTGLIATAGIFSLWRLWIYALAFLLMGFVLAASWRRVGVLTDAELTEVRYGSRPAAVLRGVKAIYFGTVFNCTVLAIVLFAAATVSEPFLVWNEWLPVGLFSPLRTAVESLGLSFAASSGDPSLQWVRSTNNVLSILAIVGVTTLYSTTGGLRSVVNTDVAQLVLMMLGTLTYAVWVVHEVGGLEEMVSAIRTTFASGGPGGITASEILAFTPDHAKDVSLALLAVFSLQWLVQMNADGTGYLAQRSMACRSDRDAKVAAVVFTFAQVLVRSLVWLPIGLGLLVLFPPDPSLGLDVLRADREATFVRGVRELLPPGLMGLMLTGMLAALASTVDTHLNWGSSYWTHDIYARFICRSLLKRDPSPRSLVWVARGANVFILLVGLGILTQLDSIQTAWQISLVLGAGMGIPLVLRWLWWRLTAWGEIAAIAASSVLAPILIFTVDSDAWRLLLVAVVSTAAAILASWIGGPEEPEVLERFYRRARPPGFWRGVAGASSDAEDRLRRGLGAMLTCAASVFCLLTGVGSWMVASPAPEWLLGSRSAWVVLNLGVGVGLVPVWLRLGLGREDDAPALREPTATGRARSRSGKVSRGTG